MILTKITAFDGAFVKAKAKGKDRKKRIKSLSKSLDQLTAKVAHLSSDLNQSRNLAVERDVEILLLRASPPEFASLF
ncbi:dual specificity protein phosphatase 1-like protein [Tanacetum coccineum]